MQHFSTGVYSTLERERTTKQKRKLRDGFKARDSSLEREIKKKGIMSCRRVLKSIQALAAHTLLFCFTLFLVLKLDHTLSSSWWSVSSLSLYLSLESLSIVLNWVCMNHLWFGSVFIFEVTHDRKFGPFLVLKREIVSLRKVSVFCLFTGLVSLIGLKVNCFPLSLSICC